MTAIAIAWRNLGRNRRRTALALAAIAVGQYMLVVAQSVYRGYGDTILAVTTGPLIGDVQIQRAEWRRERAMDATIDGLGERLAGIAAAAGVRAAAPRVVGPCLAAAGDRTLTAVVLGVDVDAESSRGGILELVPARERPGPRRVLVGRALAHELAVGPGGELAVVGQTADGFIANDLYAVGGIVESPVEMVNARGIVMALADAQALFALPAQAHQIAVRGAPGGDARALAGEIAALPAASGLEVVPWQDVVPVIAAMADLMRVAGYFIIGLLFLAAIAGITNTMMMSAFERLHEFGMLLALGCAPRRIVRMIFAEAVLLGMLGVAVGTALGLPTVLAMARAGVDVMGTGGTADMAMKGMVFPSLIFPRAAATDVIAGVVAVALTSLVAAVWPARYAARLEPMEAMRA